MNRWMARANALCTNICIHTIRQLEVGCHQNNSNLNIINSFDVDIYVYIHVIRRQKFTTRVPLYKNNKVVDRRRWLLLLMVMMTMMLLMRGCCKWLGWAVEFVLMQEDITAATDGARRSKDKVLLFLSL